MWIFHHLLFNQYLSLGYWAHLAWAAIAKYHIGGGLQDRNLQSGGWFWDQGANMVSSGVGCVLGL
jgi:hypothetical protein